MSSTTRMRSSMPSLGNVDDMQQHIGVLQFLERRLERVEQLRRQIADESDRIADEEHLAPFKLETPRRWVEGRKKLVGGVNVVVGEAVEQRALAGVGIADERD